MAGLFKAVLHGDGRGHPHGRDREPTAGTGVEQLQFDFRTGGEVGDHLEGKDRGPGRRYSDRANVWVVAVARVVSGDRYDPDIGTVTVSTAGPTVLTFQVVANLTAGTEIELQLLDARTGRRLAISTVGVAAPITVEDSLE